MNTDLPRDVWIIGDAPPNAGSHRREYVVHVTEPCFVARVVAVDEDGMPEEQEQPADLLTGIIYSRGDYVLCEVLWIDPPPDQAGVLLEAACDAVDASAD